MLGLAVAGAPMAARAGSAGDLYYERTVMAAADARCNLFTPQVSSALNAARAQARGAALRAGMGEGDLNQIGVRAQAKAGGVSCASPDVALAAGRVRTAFAGYSKLIRMTYPGDAASWRADRSLPTQGGWWRLAQTAQLQGGGALVFGLSGARGEDPQLLSVADFGAAQPYSARLLVRDPDRTPGAYLAMMRVGSTASLPLSARVAPRAATRVFAAEARGPADARLLPPGAKSATAFRFPQAAVDAIADLDPREAITVEFVFAGRTGDVTRQALIEVGDFAAGRAFMMASR